MHAAVFEGLLLAVYASRYLRDRAGGLVALLIAMCFLLPSQAGSIATGKFAIEIEPEPGHSNPVITQQRTLHSTPG